MILSKNHLIALASVAIAVAGCAECALPESPEEEDSVIYEELSDPSLIGADSFASSIGILNEEALAEVADTIYSGGQAVAEKAVLPSGYISDVCPMEFDESSRISLVVTTVSDEGFKTGFHTYKAKGRDGEFSNVSKPVEDWSKVCLATAVYPFSKAVSGFNMSGAEAYGRIFTELPNIQYYDADGLAAGAFPMVARAYGEACATKGLFSSLFGGKPSFKFDPTCGVLRLKLTSSENVTVSSIALTAADKGISGKVEYTDEGYTYAGTLNSADKTVTLVCGSTDGDGIKLSADSATSFNFVIPPAKYESFSIRVNLTNGVSRDFKIKGGSYIKITKAKYTDFKFNVLGFDTEYVIDQESLLSYDDVETHMFDKNAQAESLFGLAARLVYGIDSYPGEEDDIAYKSIVMRYKTTDPMGREVWASGRVYMSYDTNYNEVVEPGHVVLGNHYTVGASHEAPSEFYTFDLGFALQGGIVAAPDLLGYGCSSELDHPYLCPDQTAKNALDLVRAAKAYAASQGAYVEPDIELYNLGYSQGGGSALAVARYVEMNGLLDEFNLAKTCCGAGVYSPRMFFDSMIGDKPCAYPVGAPLMITGMKYCYPDEITSPLESFFSKAIVDGGIIDMIRTKQYEVDELNTAIKNAAGSENPTMAQILSSEALTPGTKVYTELRKGLELDEILTDDWTSPKTEIYFLHYENDEIVPYSIFEAAKAKFGSSWKCEFETFSGSSSIVKAISSDASALECHRGTAGLFYARMLGGDYLD